MSAASIEGTSLSGAFKLALGVSVRACFDDGGCSSELVVEKNAVRSFWQLSLFHLITVRSPRSTRAFKEVGVSQM